MIKQLDTQVKLEIRHKSTDYTDSKVSSIVQFNPSITVTVMRELITPKQLGRGGEGRGGRGQHPSRAAGTSSTGSDLVNYPPPQTDREREREREKTSAANPLSSVYTPQSAPFLGNKFSEVV